MRNSHRSDVEIDEYKSRFGRLQSKSVLPYSENCVYFLLPYWMERYYGFIIEE